MGSTLFLQETEATVVIFDLRGFADLAGRLSPVELGAALGRFYEHTESIVLGSGGRVIKFMGDIVMAAWLATGAEDHRREALDALRAAHAERPRWIQEGLDQGQPLLDYSVAAASGPVLVGHIGTERMRTFDVLGEPVSVARKLTLVATTRGLDHLVTAEALASKAGRIPAVEVEGIELGGKLIRLFRLA